jgi:hypothetical protein
VVDVVGEDARSGKEAGRIAAGEKIDGGGATRASPKAGCMRAPVLVVGAVRCVARRASAPALAWTVASAARTAAPAPVWAPVSCRAARMGSMAVVGVGTRTGGERAAGFDGASARKGWQYPAAQGAQWGWRR